MKKIYILGIISLTTLFSTLIAQTHNWTGNGGDNDWFNTANWDTGTLPIETSSVSIVGNVTVNISGSGAEAYTIDLNNNATLELESSLTTGSVITVNSNDTFHFISGILSGSTVINNGLLKIEGNQVRTFDQTTITNHNLFLITNSNQTQVIDTAIHNSSTGVIDIASVGGFLQQSTESVLNNEGLVRKSPDGINPIGNFYLILEINNEGTIEVLEDQILLLLAGTSTFTNFPSGRIVGSGTYDITTTLINEGMVVPGEESQIGTLDITNNFALNGGSIQLDISGTASGAFDKIAIIGSPDMNGTLAINLQFAPQLDDEFTVITWNLNGSNCIFPETATSIYDGLVYTFEINCNANDVTLRVSEISILGVEDITSSPQFYIQPNPVTDDAVFVFPSEWVPSEEISIVIYNFTGQEVMKLSNVSETTSFQRGNLPAGLYFAQLRESDRLLGTSKIVLE